MTPLIHLAAVELRRFRRSRLTRAALLALVLVPLLYGALYLWAFWNPSGALDQVPAALVDADRPAVVSGQQVHAGADLRSRLRTGGGFDWHVTDAADAARGLDEGRYHLVVTVPADFSASLASVAGDRPRPAVLDVRTDDANGYLAGQLSRTVLSEIRQAISTGSTKQYVQNVFLSLAQLHDRLTEAASGARDLASGSASARDGADRLASGTRELATGTHRLAAGADDASAGATRLAGGASTLAGGLATLDRSTAALPAQARTLADGAATVAAGTDRVAALGTRLTQTATQLDATRAQARDVLLAAVTAYAAAHPDDAQAQALAGQVRTGLTSLDARLGAVGTGLRSASTDAGALAAGAHQVARGAATLADAAPALTSGLHRASTGAQALADGSGDLAAGTRSLAAGADRLDAGASSAASGAAALSNGLATLDGGAHRLADGLSTAAAAVPDRTGDAAAATAGVAAAPVSLHGSPVNQAATYGEGLAPYFIPLALWVGALVTSMLLRPLGSRALASSAPSARVAVAGWLPAAALGLVQAGALVAVLHFGLGLTAVHPWALLAFLAVVAVSFAALLQWIGARFGGPGRLVALVLLMLQLTSAGGTYPIETAPAFFRWLHPLLPMSYVVTGLRHLLTGGPAGTVWQCTAVLTGFALVALAATALAARQRRMWTIGRLHPELAL